MLRITGNRWRSRSHRRWTEVIYWYLKYSPYKTDHWDLSKCLFVPLNSECYTRKETRQDKFTIWRLKYKIRRNNWKRPVHCSILIIYDNRFLLLVFATVWLQLHKLFNIFNEQKVRSFSASDKNWKQTLWNLNKSHVRERLTLKVVSLWTRLSYFIGFCETEGLITVNNIQSGSGTYFTDNRFPFMNK